MIETKNLSFIYREEDMESGEIKEEKVLKDINIEIKKGSLPPYSVTTAAENQLLQNILMLYFCRQAVRYM